MILGEALHLPEKIPTFNGWVFLVRKIINLSSPMGRKSLLSNRISIDNELGYTKDSVV